MNVAELNQIHVPDALKREQQKTNDMIVRKKSVQVTAISGSEFSNGQVFEAQVQSSAPFLLKSLKLVGKIKLKGDYSTATAKLQEDIHSIVEQVDISYNTQQLVNINKNAALVAYVHKRSNYTQEEKTYRDLQELAGVNMPLEGGAPLDFVMGLDVYGLDQGYLLPTGSGSKLSVRLTFASNVGNVFWGAADAAKKVTGFDLSDCYLVCDQYTLTASADSIIKSALTSDPGAEYPMLAYDLHEQNLPVSTTQNLLVPQSYRNVVSNYFLPLAAQEVPAEPGIPAASRFLNLKFGNGADGVPQKAVIEFSGSDSVSINGAVGQSGRMQALQSLINVSKKELNDRVSGYGWGKAYETNANIGVFAGSFLKSDEKHAYIMNSGFNGYLSNGQLNCRFTLGANPAANGYFITIMQFTRILKVSSKGTERLQ